MPTISVNHSYVDDSVQPNRATSNTLADLIYRYYRDASGLAVPFETEEVEGPVVDEEPVDRPVK